MDQADVKTWQWNQGSAWIEQGCSPGSGPQGWLIGLQTEETPWTKLYPAATDDQCPKEAHDEDKNLHKL